MFMIFLLLLELIYYIYFRIYLFTCVFIQFVCVAYPLTVRSTMEIRRSHLCDFFLVFPFYNILLRYCVVNKILKKKKL